MRGRCVEEGVREKADEAEEGGARACRGPGDGHGVAEGADDDPRADLGRRREERRNTQGKGSSKSIEQEQEE